MDCVVVIKEVQREAESVKELFSFVWSFITITEVRNVSAPTEPALTAHLVLCLAVHEYLHAFIEEGVRLYEVHQIELDWVRLPSVPH